MLQHEIERALADGSYVPRTGETVVMIQCVGSRNEERPYCSSICCSMAVKNALLIKQRAPSANVVILYRDTMTYGFREEYYEKARNEGVTFISYARDRMPSVEELQGGLLEVRVWDNILGAEVSIPAHLIGLSTAIEPSRDEAFDRILAVTRSSDGFFMESHVQLRPVDSYTDGIFICGMAHAPKPVDEAIAQAKAAASKTAILLSKGFVKAEPIVASCAPEICTGCGMCEHFCPYGSITMAKKEKGRVAEIIVAACKGCGVCASYCPVKAISMGRFTDEQIYAQIEAFGVIVREEQVS
jgi:heterodisulfide reductase subunit A